MRHTNGVEPTFERLAAATAHLEPPFAVLDRVGLEHNIKNLVTRAQPKPLRLATKSVRVRSIIEEALDQGFASVMTYSLNESLWLHRTGVKDIVVAYPSVDAHAIAELGSDEDAARNITLMIDSRAGLEFIAKHFGSRGVRIRVALDIDASLKIGPAHLGARRSPLHTAEQVEALAREIISDTRFHLAGVMFYDAQIAGLADDSAAVRLVKKLSLSELADRRAQIVRRLRALSDLEFINAGGTGSLDLMATAPEITELTAGSGIFHSHHFDGYRNFSGMPAAFFVTAVVRKPSQDIATVFSGGYIASGQANDSRLPKPVWPPGLKLLSTEGAGEVQTPLKHAHNLAISDRVWFRHTKAGEMCERFDEIHIVDESGQVTTVPTYRGEGRNFG